MNTPKMEEWLRSSGNETVWGARECNIMFSDFLICCSDLRGHSHEFLRLKKNISLIIPTPPLTHSNIYFSNQSFWRWVALWVTGKSDALSEMILTFLFLCTKTFIVQQFVWLWRYTQGFFYHNINITVFRKWKCGSNCFVCLCFQGFSFVNISCSQLLLFAVLALESVQLFDCQNAHSLDTHN